MNRYRTLAAVAAVACAPAVAHAALTIEGPWTLDPGTSEYTLPLTLEPAAFEAFLIETLPTYEGGAALAAGLTGDAIVAIDRLWYRLYDDGSGQTFGELGGDVTFNPLATGGTAEISTGGEFIDKQLNQQKEQFEVAHQQDVENEVFKQEFGQVQAQRPTKSGARGTLEPLTISFRSLVLIPPGALDVDASNQTAPFHVTLEVPAPISALALAPLALAARRRR